MPYSKFSLQKAQQDFGLMNNEAKILLPTLPTISPDTLLTAILADNLPLALAQDNEKARSEGF